MSGSQGRQASGQQANDQVFAVKRCSFRGKGVSILLQNTNGPCPLLSIANVLLLRRAFGIHPDHKYVPLDMLCQKLGGRLLDTLPKGADANQRAVMDNAIQCFPQLSVGLDVNVRFSGVTSFEYTQQLSLFDLFNIKLVHGWLPDPAQKDVYAAVHPHSYNQVAEWAVIADEKASTDDGKRAALCRSFITSTSSQLTPYGISQLRRHLQEGELAVLFRNNHFTVILKQGGKLFSLLTDLGFADSVHMWETLDAVLVSHFFNPSFQPSSPQHSAAQSADDIVPDFPRQVSRPEQKGGMLLPAGMVSSDAILADQMRLEEESKRQHQLNMQKRLQHQRSLSDLSSQSDEKKGVSPRTSARDVVLPMGAYGRSDEITLTDEAIARAMQNEENQRRDAVLAQQLQRREMLQRADSDLSVHDDEGSQDDSRTSESTFCIIFTFVVIVTVIVAVLAKTQS